MYIVCYETKTHVQMQEFNCSRMLSNSHIKQECKRNVSIIHKQKRKYRHFWSFFGFYDSFFGSF